MNRYYSKLRPVSIGTYPVGMAVETHNYDHRQYVEDAGCEVYGYIDYNRKLSEDEINHYDLIPGGLTTYWVVITSVYDTGRVTCNIVARERHARKPDHYHTSTQRKDIYIDYFESQEEAEQFVSESRKA